MNKPDDKPTPKTTPKPPPKPSEPTNLPSGYGEFRGNEHVVPKKDDGKGGSKKDK